MSVHLLYQCHQGHSKWFPKIVWIVRTKLDADCRLVLKLTTLRTSPPSRNQTPIAVRSKKKSGPWWHCDWSGFSQILLFRQSKLGCGLHFELPLVRRSISSSGSFSGLIAVQLRNNARCHEESFHLFLEVLGECLLFQGEFCCLKTEWRDRDEICFHRHDHHFIVFAFALPILSVYLSWTGFLSQCIKSYGDEAWQDGIKSLWAFFFFFLFLLLLTGVIMVRCMTCHQKLLFTLVVDFATVIFAKRKSSKKVKLKTMINVANIKSHFAQLIN